MNLIPKVTDEHPTGQMDNPNLQQQQTQPLPQPQQQSSTKNVKNLSIKEFFATRLMRARSFEGGPNSPKDEPLNWFDEFKARMTKKSQANSSKQTVSGSISNTVDDNNDELLDSSETVVRFATQPKPKHHHNKDDHIAPLVKDSCDTYLSQLTESDEDLDEISPDNCSQSLKDTSNLTSKTRSTGSRARISPGISSVESPDFDTASINTIFNRRDSRYETIQRNPYKLFLSRIFGLIKWVISYLLPFNYNLPWKLLTFINFTFVIIVIGMAGKTDPDIMAFRFFNGFICGILVATFCFIIVILSLLVQILPKSRESETSSVDKIITDASIISEKSMTLNSSLIDVKNGDKNTGAADPAEQKLEDFSVIEVLGSGNRPLCEPADGAIRNETLLDDDDYKGWMIEFIGDYEMRNKSDIKLKLIFVKIESRILYLCKPKNSHDAESATFPVFVQQRIYDLNTAPKFSANLLLPKNVRNRQKWVWSKKYPIRLEFQDDSDQAAKICDTPKVVQLTLFAKSCREKEEWFRRFKRIVEENRLAQVNSNKRSSLKSNLSDGCDDSYLGSVKSFRCRSPSPSARRDCVQTSHSSHILNDSKRMMEDENKLQVPDSNLVRTKSCEQLHGDQTPSTVLNDQDRLDDDTPQFEASFADDSTLTRETAEIFSQAVEHSNFMESRPNFSYREYIERVIDSSRDASSTSDWFNALTGRIFFDVFSHNYWSFWFKRKIQRKLYRIRLPYFMETLTLTKIDLGTNAPQFLNVVSHSFDSFGLSIDFDMAYSGGLTMTFETKLNLLKIKSDNSTSNASSTSNQSANNVSSTSNTQNPISTQPSDTSTRETSSISDSSSDNPYREGVKPSLSSSGSARTSGESSDSDESESDSSSDSSFDEAEVDEISDWEDYGAEKTRQSIVRFVDKIASSRYFQHATENRYIKKKLQDISNCPLVLVVKIESLNGVLTLNVPPPQTDRIWYGFKPNPELTLKALPKMGDREVNLSHVTDWIERKLAEEFRKILVIPNMEDIVLPVLKSDHLLYCATTK